MAGRLVRSMASWEETYESTRIEARILESGSDCLFLLPIRSGEIDLFRRMKDDMLVLLRELK